ncbi:MAG: hypothetical protein KUA37_02070 [Desulfomicrobium sp.]|nr:hypothetical protein [Pseudomonadota bacterium]MBV1710778.1 hypothetical protein [Desulfomicrobium sp.]MBU4570386.1 hypothetical protein [Pseudomonadota bacterium]MBU4593307.1 hypothetical protein [Pseudomonadota bacterium]MBV1721569.1 hypothetical protein [Desulfomicrobium sp.]
MSETNLLASVALFRALYDNKKNIYDVITEFIKTSIIINSKWSFNSIECVQYLNKDFGFEIPNAVVSSCLKNRLKKSGEINFYDGIYTVTEKFDKNQSIFERIEDSKFYYKEIIENLLSYAVYVLNKKVDVERLKSDFKEYLVRSGRDSEYTGVITRFLIENEFSSGFKEKLGQIEEGLILYAGIRYTPDLSSLGQWKNNLVIFLDTEHLLSAAGLNGVLYKKVFDDFNSLINDVNQKKNNGKISLRYFSETNDDIINFFYAAEKIVERSEQADPSKTAMLAIVDGCKSPSDVLHKKSKFYDDLFKLKIRNEDMMNYYENPEFNIESASSIAALCDRFKLSGSHKDNFISVTLKKFTKINVIRKGISDVGIDGVSAIFMTENNLVKNISFSDVVHAGNGAIPYATNIEFLTERLWFKLNKGFSKDARKPVSFDTIIRAKLVLASQISNAVSETYKDLKEKYKNNEINKEQIGILLSELKSMPSSPDDIDSHTIDDSSCILKTNYIEESLKVISILKQESAEGTLAKRELSKIKYQQRSEKRKPLKAIARRQYALLQLFVYIFVPLFFIAIVINFYNPNDTSLSIMFGLTTLIGLALQFVSYKFINKLIWKISTNWYKKNINSIILNCT